MKMNKICITCDTRIRLQLCDGKNHSHKFCFRKCGSIEGTRETVTPFTEISELYENDFIRNCGVKKLEIKSYNHDHIKILMGEFPDGQYTTVGYVIY